ncbi:MAG: hypothetical protein C3F13_17245 [Anaerolineales bacterium]|nr:hybrid sensor histidine kinase/response regulator [Anaerolineae bacterium]PWB50213.1 MAG: hypothetical protein C3F13_17245 [Anaerolineales bacterium]
MINRMDSHNEHVILIESDPQISKLIAEQSLKPLGFQVDVYESAAAILQEVEDLAPDVIVTSLNLIGLSGKDLLIALKAEGIDVPIVVTANKGQEADILQAIRLGAVDYITCPIREVEVINVIENVLNKQMLKQQVEIYSVNLDQTKSAMEHQLADFSQIFSFARLALSTKNLQILNDKIISLAMLVTEADCAWLLSSDGSQAAFILQACHNAPEKVTASLHLPYEDEISALAGASGQVVSVHGEALSRFTGYEQFGSVLAVPVLSNGQVESIIIVARSLAQPFSNSHQAMLELVVNVASSALENCQRFHQLERSLTLLQQSFVYTSIESNIKSDLLRQASLEIRTPLKNMMENVDVLLEKGELQLNQEQAIALDDVQEDTEILMDIADSMINSRQSEPMRLVEIDLNEVVRNITNRFKPIAQLGKITLTVSAPAEPVNLKVYPSQITKVIEGLLSNALKYSPPNGEIILQISERDTDISLSVSDQGNGIDEQAAEWLFQQKSNLFGYTANRFGGIGISLPMIKEIVTTYKGKIWMEPMQEKGFKITFSLPR